MSLVATATKVLEFVGGAAPAIAKLIEHIDSGADDPEKEHQLALDIVREAKRAKARDLGLL
jgi:hypothetical protein